MEDRETSRMHKYLESKTTRIVMEIVRHVTCGAGRMKFQAIWFCWPECTLLCPFVFSSTWSRSSNDFREI